MKLTGSHPLPYPREVVWRGLLDPEVLQRTLPGCRKLERTGEQTFAGVLEVQVGPVRGQFQGTLELSDLRPPESYLMKLAGQGPPGFMTGEGVVRLQEEGPGTVLHYDLEAQVGGRVAGVGQRVLESSARVVARQGLEGLERELAARADAAQAAAAGGEAPESPGARAAPAPSALAGPFLVALFRELVPLRWRAWVLTGVGAVLLAAAMLLARACME